MTLTLADIGIIAGIFSAVVSPIYKMVFGLRKEVSYMKGVCDSRRCD